MFAATAAAMERIEIYVYGTASGLCCGRYRAVGVIDAVANVRREIWQLAHRVASPRLARALVLAP